MDYLIESLIDGDIPFLFAYASFGEDLPRKLIDRIEARPNACAVKFAPQWQVLLHQAVGSFFVSLKLQAIITVLGQRSDSRLLLSDSLRM